MLKLIKGMCWSPGVQKLMHGLWFSVIDLGWISVVTWESSGGRGWRYFVSSGFFSLLNSCVFQWIFSWRWHDRLHQASLSPLTLSCLTDRYQHLQACREMVLRLCASLLFIIHEQNIGFLYSLSSFRARSRFPPDLQFPGSLCPQTPLVTLLLCRYCPPVSHRDTKQLLLLLPVSALLLLLFLQGVHASRVCVCLFIEQ